VKCLTYNRPHQATACPLWRCRPPGGPFSDHDSCACLLLLSAATGQWRRAVGGLAAAAVARLLHASVGRHGRLQRLVDVLLSCARRGAEAMPQPELARACAQAAQQGWPQAQWSARQNGSWQEVTGSLCTADPGAPAGALARKGKSTWSRLESRGLLQLV